MLSESLLGVWKIIIFSKLWIIYQLYIFPPLMLDLFLKPAKQSKSEFLLLSPAVPSPNLRPHILYIFILDPSPLTSCKSSYSSSPSSPSSPSSNSTPSISSPACRIQISFINVPKCFEIDYVSILLTFDWFETSVNSL